MDFSTPTKEPAPSSTTVYTLMDLSSEACQRYDTAILLTSLSLRIFSCLLWILSTFHVPHAPTSTASCSTSSQDSKPDLQSSSSSLLPHGKFWRSPTVSSEASTPDHGPYDNLHLPLFPGSTIQHNLDWLNTGDLLDLTPLPPRVLECPDNVGQTVFSPVEVRQIWFHLLIYCTVVLCGIAKPILTFAKRAHIVLGWETDSGIRLFVPHLSHASVHRTPAPGIGVREDQLLCLRAQ